MNFVLLVSVLWVVVFGMAPAGVKRPREVR